MKQIGDILLLVLCLFWPLNSAADLAVIVHPKNSLEQLSYGEMRGYFLKRRRVWPSGNDVIPLDRPLGSPERSCFLKQVLEMSPSDLEYHWIEMKQTTGESPPQKIATDELTISLVNTLEGALGYVKESALESDTTRVKVVGIIQE